MDLKFHEEGHLGGYVIGRPDPACWMPNMWQFLVQLFSIESVIDLGCGEAHTTKFFCDLGLRVRGVEGCKRAIEESILPGFVDLHDFTNGPYISKETWDFVWCCEVVEHIQEQYLPNLLATIESTKCSHIALTHALPGQGGWHHVNCQGAGYWLDKFKEIGYHLNEDITEKARVLAALDSPFNHFTKSGLVLSLDCSSKVVAT